MKTSKWRRTSFALQGLLLPVAAAAAQGIQYTRIIGTGDQVPGVRGFTITGFGLFLPQIDNAGNVLFAAGWQSGPFPSDTQGGLFYGGPGSLVPVQIQGQQAPGLPEGWYIYPNWLYVLSENGTIAMRVSALGTPGNGGHGVYVGPAGSLELVAGTGLPAVGEVPGTTTAIGDLFRANAIGQVAFSQGVSNPGGSPSSYGTIAAGPPGGFGTVYQMYGPVPTLPGATFLPGVSGLSYNDLGWAGFSAFMEGPGINSSNYYAMFVGGPGDLHMVAREGDPAPGAGPGVNFINFVNRPSQNADGDVEFFGVLHGPGIDNSNGFGLWAGPRDDLQLVARVGSQAHGLPTGTNYTEFRDNGLADGHHMFFRASFAGPGVTTSNDEGYWWGEYTDPQLLVRDGDAAPGFPEGTVFHFTDNPFLRPVLIPNDSGDLLLLGETAGPGVTDADRYALWFRDAESQGWQLAVRTGDPLDGKTIAAGVYALVLLDPFGTEGSGQSFNDHGTFALNIGFTDGTHALYRFAVPEPGALSLLLGACACMCLGERRRARG